MAARLKVTEADRAMLEAWLRAPTLAQGLALRARVILACEHKERVANRAIVREILRLVWPDQ
jgi:hypothetical protein